MKRYSIIKQNGGKTDNNINNVVKLDGINCKNTNFPYENAGIIL